MLLVKVFGLQKNTTNTNNNVRHLATLGVVNIEGWQIKASSLDDQILIIGFRPVTVEYFFKMFYNENEAFNFIESLHDQNYKITDR